MTERSSDPPIFAENEVCKHEEKMTEAPISTPPQAYMDIIETLIDKARVFLEAGEKLQPMAFVGNMTTKQVVPVMIQTGSQRPVCADDPVSGVGIGG